MIVDIDPRRVMDDAHTLELQALSAHERGDIFSAASMAGAALALAKLASLLLEDEAA